MQSFESSKISISIRKYKLTQIDVNVVRLLGHVLRESRRGSASTCWRSTDCSTTTRAYFKLQEPANKIYVFMWKQNLTKAIFLYKAGLMTCLYSGLEMFKVFLVQCKNEDWLLAVNPGPWP